MAIYTPGPLIGQVSGSVGAVVFSHNKGGSYIRNRVTPTKATSEYAALAKARMTQVSQAWQGLTVAQREGWSNWSKTNPTLNALGQSRVLAGHVCFIRSGCTALATGAAILEDPPVDPAAPPLSVLTLTADIGIGNVEIAFAPTPTAAQERLMIWAAVVDSPGISYVENLYKLCAVSGLAQASPYVFGATVEARFGALQIGQTLFVKVAVVHSGNNQPSLGIKDSAVVVST